MASGPRVGVYSRLVQQHGLFEANTLGLYLGLEDQRIRFHAGGASLPDHEDLLSRLARAVDDATLRAAEESQRAAELTARLAVLETQIKRLRDED